jgi:hypothetical protein
MSAPAGVMPLPVAGRPDDQDGHAASDDQVPANNPQRAVANQPLAVAQEPADLPQEQAAQQRQQPMTGSRIPAAAALCRALIGVCLIVVAILMYSWFGLGWHPYTHLQSWGQPPVAVRSQPNGVGGARYTMETVHSTVQLDLGGEWRAGQDIVVVQRPNADPTHEPLHWRQ